MGHCLDLRLRQVVPLTSNSLHHSVNCFDICLFVLCCDNENWQFSLFKHQMHTLHFSRHVYIQSCNLRALSHLFITNNAIYNVYLHKCNNMNTTLNATLNAGNAIPQA